MRPLDRPCDRRSLLRRPAPLTLTLAVALVMATSPGPSAAAQPTAGLRRSTTVAALVTYPAFFHGHPVRVRGELRTGAGGALLVADAREIALVGPAAPAATAEPDRYVEVLGTFLDAGRLEPGDPRLRGLDLAALTEARLGRSRAGFGELPLLVVEDLGDALPMDQISVRSLALEPSRFLGQPVTVTGRFRGRNLFGDQPNAPGRSRWDFVLQVADASVWVTGLRPRGSGFSLDPEARGDAGRWLEVQGIARAARGLVFIEATSIRVARALEDQSAAVPVVRVPVQGPPPEVLFSTPTQEETGVALTTVVRIQVSRDLREESLRDRVRVIYRPDGALDRGEIGPPPLVYTVTYNAPARAIEVRFREPLASARTVIVSLLEGIEATDGAPLRPWTLVFSTGN